MMNGLSREEAEIRKREGKYNRPDLPGTRTYGQILKENCLTFFNFLNAALFLLILYVRSFKNGLFIFLVIANTIIGILQEVRAKRVIDRLSIMRESKTRVVRSGKVQEIDVQDLVLGDIVLLRSGDQVPSDAVVMEGFLEVNEALLTGEADPLPKDEGDELFSGSFVTSGEAYCEIMHVGPDNYASTITKEAKKYRKHRSELQRSMDLILKGVGILLVPLGAALFYKQYFLMHNSFQDSVVHTVSAVLGMIPEGLILLTSVSLALGALALAFRKTLVQDLYCLESLARADILCLDKTGTLTEGRMVVEDTAILQAAEQEGWNEQKLKEVMGNILIISKDQDPTSEALRAYFPSAMEYEASNVFPFSSERKYSGASFCEQGTYLIGAQQFLFPDGNRELEQICGTYTASGYRVLVLAWSPACLNDPELPSDLEPKALLLLSDVIRKDARETLEFFARQGVECRILTGDDAVTAAHIAEKAGLPDAFSAIDMSEIRTEEELQKAVSSCRVFGRVSPQQKKDLIAAMKKEGHVVAMMGDGVNDVLALREADCSIAMSEGSEAAKNVANIVLLASQFDSLPHVVNEGRRVVNNIRMASSMFLVKTFFSMFLALITIFWGNVYPFEPVHMTLISFCAVGAPAFLLSREKNERKIRRSFLRDIFIHSFPAALTISGCVFAIMMACENVYHSSTMLSTACVLVTGWNYMATLRTVYAPMTLYRRIVIYGMQLVFFVTAVFFQDILAMGSLEFGMIILVFICMTFAPLIIEGITGGLRAIFEKVERKRLKRKHRRS